MADDTVPQDDPAALDQEERILAACDWSDYRKDYGVSADPDALRREHRAFIHAWMMGRRSSR